MRVKVSGYAAALVIALTTQCTSAADAVQADVIVHVARSQPTHRLVQTAQVVLAYGEGPDTIGFEPAGPERQPVGPSAFDVDPSGAYVVADPVHQQILRFEQRAGAAIVTRLGDLPLPFAELAIDRDGWIYLTDQRSRTLTTIQGSTATRTALPGKGRTAGFVRLGDEVVLTAGPSAHRLSRGARVPATRAVSVKKCNAEAGLITKAPGGEQIQVELGGPLASMRLIGVNAAGDTFLRVERFRQRGRLDVDRHVLVVSASGALKAQLAVVGEPALHPEREFVLGPRGALHRMVPGAQGVTFRRWEVRP